MNSFLRFLEVNYVAGIFCLAIGFLIYGIEEDARKDAARFTLSSIILGALGGLLCLAVIMYKAAFPKDMDEDRYSRR